MNCREAQSQLFAERDGALDNNQRAALDGHLAQCDDCRRTRENLTAVFIAWQVKSNRAPLPNIEREWHAVRRRIRGGVEAGATRGTHQPRNLFAWIGVPLGAAAAVALAFFVSPQLTSTSPAPARGSGQIAQANSVDVPGNNAATMVFVDDKSGWLFVWASDAAPKQG